MRAEVRAIKLHNRGATQLVVVVGSSWKQELSSSIASIFSRSPAVCLKASRDVGIAKFPSSWLISLSVHIFSSKAKALAPAVAIAIVALVRARLPLD